MRLRVIGIGAAATLALGMFAGSASASVGWLNYFGAVRGTNGEAAEVSLRLTSTCTVKEKGTLVKNGAATDVLQFQGASFGGCAGEEKVTGEVKGVKLVVPPENTMTLLTSAIHVLVPPWCVYTYPSKIVMTGAYAPKPHESDFTDYGGPIALPLDKAASFGKCESTLATSWTLAFGHPEEGVYLTEWE
ncbi:MAG TPA: hypothetical protein VGN08_06265 [Solirubrobacteraceae bacterium]|jgi:hypothetical protein